MIIQGSTFQAVMEALRGKLTPEDALRDFEPSRPLIEQIVDANVLILGMFRVPREVLDAAPRLRLIHQHGRGIDGVDLAHATEKGVLVANVPGGNSVAVAEHALALMFYMAKRMYATKRHVAERVIGSPAGLELKGKTLGIVGLGSSGMELATRARALEMRVIAIRSRPETPPGAAVDFVGGPQDLPRLLAESDFVSLHLPLMDRTRGLIGHRELRQMKGSAYLLNVARGPLVDYEALLAALRSNLIDGAAFDVFWDEPADPSDPIFACENFVLTPHVAGFSDGSIDYVTDVIAENLRRLRRDEALLNVVNPEAYGRHSSP